MRAAAVEGLPGLGDVEIDGADAGLLGEHQRIGRLPDLDRIGAVGDCIADEAGRRRVDDLDLAEVDALPLLKEFGHLVVRGGARAGELLALEVLQRFDVFARSDDRAPVVEQVEQVFDLDAAHVGEPHRRERGAAADLEFAGVELRGIGIGRALLEGDVEAVRNVELLRLDHRRQQRAKRRRREDHDGELLGWARASAVAPNAKAEAASASAGSRAGGSRESPGFN